MKVQNKYGVDVTSYVILLLENRITKKEYELLINKKYK